MKINLNHQKIVLTVEEADLQTNHISYLKLKKYTHLRNKQTVWDNSLIANDQFILDKIDNPEVVPSFVDVDIVYEDDLLVVAYKEKGLLTHPDGQHQDTLLNRVKAYFVMKGEDINPAVAHRLDVLTSGLVLFVKYKNFLAYFDFLLATKQIKRYYYALVHGDFKVNQKIVLNYPIAKNRHLSNVYRVAISGKESLSLGKCIFNNRKQSISLMQMQLKTGRRHQLRVHLSHIQHPIIGDPVYGLLNDGNRMYLQAYKLLLDSLFHKQLDIEIPMEEDFLEYIQTYE